MFRSLRCKSCCSSEEWNEASDIFEFLEEGKCHSCESSESSRSIRIVDVPEGVLVIWDDEL